MEGQTKRLFRWFWAWQDDKEEAWLESMARQGWHLKEVGLPIYTFEQGAPRDDIYRLDFQMDKDLAEYIEFIESTGWEHIGQLFGWQYFRRPLEQGGSVEFYTDPESKIAKHKRLLRAIVVTSPAWMVVFLPLLDRYPLWFAVILVIFFVTLIVLHALALVNISRRIRRLEQL